MRWKYLQKLGERIRSDEKRKGKDVSSNDAINQAAEVWRDTLYYCLGLKKKDFNKWWKDQRESDTSSTENDNEEYLTYADNSFAENQLEEEDNS